MAVSQRSSLQLQGGSSAGSRAIHIPGYHMVVEPTFGDNQERHDPGQLQERSAPVEALGRYQWLALSSDLCKVLLGMNTPLTKRRVLLPLPTTEPCTVTHLC